MLVLILLAVIPVSVSQLCCDGSSCSLPQNPKQFFACPARPWTQLISTFPEDWYLNPLAANFGIPKQCQRGNKTYSACTHDSDCNGIAGACAPAETSAFTLVNSYMSCCRHCVWDMQFPMGAPIQVTAGPVPNSSISELYMIPLLNCVNFPAEWAKLDINGDHYLSTPEFEQFFDTLPNRELVAQGMLNQSAVQWAADINKDQLISYQEYVVLRHFWTPTLISNSGPAPTSNGAGASGPLGGLFYDSEMVSVWVTTANNILLRLYLLNNWNSAATREPLTGEEQDYNRIADLDGSGLISLEEHYFRVFADLDQNGELNETEYLLSLYADSLTLKNGSLYPPRYSFASHDLDGSGEVSYLERKRLSADLNFDGVLDSSEWSFGDFPPDPLIFAQHASAAGVIGGPEYHYYRIYDICSLYRWQLYNTPNSTTNGIAWNYQTCVLKVVTYETLPFVNATAARRRRDLVTQSGTTLTGYSPSVWSTLSNNLGFTQSVSLLPGAENASQLRLLPPAIDATGTITFEVALLNLFQQPPAEWVCSGSYWPEDGFVIVVRAAPTAVNLYLVVIDMVISPQFVNFFSSLFFLVLGVGHIIWLLECWHNELQFRKFYSEGVIDGLWWAIVTQTTNGFGDKAPITLPGKAFAVFWMIFGLITFAVFAGQATSIIATATAINSISTFSNIAGLNVGTLAGTPGVQLSQALAFNNVACATMAVCVSQLLAAQTDAVLAPRSNVVNYFVSSGLDTASCGNPVMIVGSTLPLGYVSGAGPSLQVCTYGQGVYAGTLLTNAISAEINSMSSDGTIANLLGSVDVYENVADACLTPPTFYVPLNAAAAGVLFFFIIGRSIERRMYREGVAGEAVDMGDIAKSIMALSKKAAPPSADGEAAAAAADAEVLPDLEDVEELVAVARRVGLFHAMQSGSVRKMQRELRKQKNLLTSVVKLMIFTSASVACGLAMVVGILIAVWSDKIQLAQYW